MMASIVSHKRDSMQGRCQSASYTRCTTQQRLRRASFVVTLLLPYSRCAVLEAPEPGSPPAEVVRSAGPDRPPGRPYLSSRGKSRGATALSLFLGFGVARFCLPSVVVVRWAGTSFPLLRTAAAFPSTRYFSSERGSAKTTSPADSRPRHAARREHRKD
ncbi:hypothetical protein HPB50_021606 [Hyalomma asiaticum]|uniref:Uncharacterized protein n=1 Tax=Hyalomma asiaticum TaxID=266040 RepID=A0ACB7T1B7_HYAAI|nr:hypothetical protein HPB50_021606 [Hyalomma asiaticum]